MRRFIVNIANFFDFIARWVIIVLMAAISCVAIFQVATRFIIHEPSAWSEELLRRGMVWLVAIGIAVIFRRGGHISVDVIKMIKIPILQKLIRYIVFLVSFAFLIILVWLGADMAWRVRFQTFASLEVSMFWAYVSIPIGAGLSAIAIVAHFLDPENLKQVVRGEKGESLCQE